ncbi:hypothetical protein EG329_013368 [Mollisiaceae sp. DMI_Dod_QoI]|nr:hypothetical protein EG329_013368 [Helotiales sp. DMI_Dod_QoI]
MTMVKVTRSLKTSAGLRTAGCPDHLEYCISKQDSLANLAVAGNDKVVSQQNSKYGPENSNLIELPEAGPTEGSASILKQYDSFDAYLRNIGKELLHCRGALRQIVANQSSFTLLSGDCEVWTWGDGRYEACLGREVSDMKTAATPCVVEDLLDLPTGPIRKISSGGYVTAALTEGNDLYVWGGRPGQQMLLEELTAAPTPVDLDGQDVLDVAVGMNHMIALTTEGKLFVVGDGRKGQLGLVITELVAWREVSLPLKDNERITSVYAGYKNSLVIVEDIT